MLLSGRNIVTIKHIVDSLQYVSHISPLPPWFGGSQIYHEWVRQHSLYSLVHDYSDELKYARRLTFECSRKLQSFFSVGHNFNTSEYYYSNREYSANGLTCCSLFPPYSRSSSTMVMSFLAASNSCKQSECLALQVH